MQTFHPEPPHDAAAAYLAPTLKEAIRRATARMRNPQFRAEAAEACATGRTVEIKLVIAPGNDGKINAKVLYSEHTQREMIYCSKNLPPPDKDDAETWGNQQEGGRL